MTVDETDLEYECRACGRKKSVRKRMVQHVNEMSDSAHRGRSPDDLIMAVYPSVMPEDSSNSTYNDIVDAFERIISNNVKGLGPEIKNEEIDKVTELSGEPKSKCVRILQEERIPYTFKGRHPHTYFDELSDNQKEILAYYYHHPTDSLVDISDEFDADRSTVSHAISKREWMLEGRFRPEEIDNWYNDDKDVDVDEMINKVKDEEDVAEEMVEQGGQSEADDTNEDEEVEGINISDEDTMYEIIEALIRNGNEERAREMFDIAVNN